MTETPTVDTSKLEGLSLEKGAHTSPKDGMCVMEAVAFVAGERFSDNPQCASRVIGAFLRSWNDDLPSDEDRTRLLKPLIPRLVGTAAPYEIEERRAFLSIDWYIREFLPAWLDLLPTCTEDAATLRSLLPVVDLATLSAAAPLLEAAREKA